MRCSAPRITTATGHRFCGVYGPGSQLSTGLASSSFRTADLTRIRSSSFEIHHQDATSVVFFSETSTTRIVVAGGARSCHIDQGAKCACNRLWSGQFDGATRRSFGFGLQIERGHDGDADFDAGRLNPHGFGFNLVLVVDSRLRTGGLRAVVVRECEIVAFTGDRPGPSIPSLRNRAVSRSRMGRYGDPLRRSQSRITCRARRRSPLTPTLSHEEIVQLS